MGAVFCFLFGQLRIEGIIYAVCLSLERTVGRDASVEVRWVLTVVFGFCLSCLIVVVDRFSNASETSALCYEVM